MGTANGTGRKEKSVQNRRKSFELRASSFDNNEQLKMDAAGYKAQGNIYLQAKEYAQAIESYSKAIELNPTDHVFYSNNLRQFFTKKDGDEKWQPMSGIPTIIYDAEFFDQGLMIKNSRGFFREKENYDFEMDEMKHPDLRAATLYLFMIEIHTGNAIHPQFKWISDIFTIMGIIMVITGPILWWRRKW